MKANRQLYPCMSSPQLDNLSTIPEATDGLWPLIIQENNPVLEPSMFHCQESRNVGKELLENGNLRQKDDKDDSLSTSIQVVLDQWSFTRGSSSSMQPIMDNGNGDELDSILFLEQENSALTNHNIDKVLLLSPVSASDYACSLLQVSSTSIEDNARTNKLDSSTFILDPVEPNMDEGSLQSRRLNHPIDNGLSAPPDDLDELDLLLRESSTPFPRTDEKSRDDQTDLSLVPGQESSALAEPSSGKGLKSKRFIAKTKERNYKFRGLQTAGNNEAQADKGEWSTVKKQEHNAKERIRRMKLHASYLALGALLPDSSRSKKRKSAPLIIDRAAQYIPELEEEIEKLTLRKNDMLSKTENKQPLDPNPHFQVQDPSVSVHEIRQGEVIIQICVQRHSDDGAFSNLLQKVEEEEGTCITSASTLQVSDDGIVCYHLHIKMNVSLNGANHLASFREKVVSWLC